MNSINRTGKNLTIGWYKGTDIVRGNYIKGWTYSHPAQTCGHDCGENTGYLALFRGEFDPFLTVRGWDGKELEIGPLPNDHDVVIVERDDKLGYADWTSVYAKWSGQAATLAAESAKINEGLEIAKSLIEALSLGIAAIPEVGALPGGALLGIGSLFLQQLGKNVPSPPPPPDVDAIADAVKTVLTEELDARDAAEASSTFLTIAGWLEDQAMVAHAAVRGHGAKPPLGDFSDHDEDDFRNDLEEYRRDGGDFQKTLDQVVRNSSESKYILPSFLVGIATSLQIKRLHETVRHLDGADLTDEDVQRYKDKAQFYLDGVDSAARALNAFVASKVQKENLQGTDEGTALTRIITKIHTGQEDLTFVDVQKRQIQENIIAKLELDIAALKAGQECQYFYKPEWDTHPRAKKQRGH